MEVSHRLKGWVIPIILLITICAFLIYPAVLLGTPFALLFQDMEISIVTVLFAGMFFLLILLLYLGNR